MIVIDSTLSYPDYASAIGTEKYEKAKNAYEEAFLANETGKKIGERRGAWLTVAIAPFNKLENTKIDLYQLLPELAKVSEASTQIGQPDRDDHKEVRRKFVSKFLEKAFDQSEFQDELLSKNLTPMDNHMPQFLRVIDETFRLVNFPAKEIVRLSKSMYAYSAKHGHSKAQQIGVSDLTYGIHGISGALLGTNCYSGATGGDMGKASVLIYLFSYRFIENKKLYTILDFLRTEDMTRYGISSTSLLSEVSDLLKLDEKKTGITLNQPSRLKFLQVTPDHGQSFEKLVVIPSNAQLELIAAIADSHYDSVQRMNEEVHVKNMEGMSDKEKKAYEKVKPRNQYGWKFKNVGTVASNAQNVSVLYQKLFSRGVPRFINIPFIRNTEVGNNKLHVIDQWFASRKLIAKDQESIKVKFGTVSNLAPLLPNRAQASSSRGAINSTAYILHEHLKYHLKSLRRSKEYVQANLHQLDSELGLIKLVLGESLSHEEALALSEVIVNKVTDCPETLRPELVEALKGYLV